ncbi:MAG: hypothetical protein ACLR4Z_05860 [Butyricicoccaceae bacterium]
MLCRGQAIGLAVLFFGAGVLIGSLLTPCWTGTAAGGGSHCSGSAPVSKPVRREESVMKVAVWKSPKCLCGILRYIFHIR